MTTRANYYINTADEFLAKARAYLADDDLLQASEKGWGAATQMAKAVAESRGWQHASHRDLHHTVDRLADDAQIRALFLSANALHTNFYEGWMTAGLVDQGLSDVEALVGLLEPLLS